MFVLVLAATLALAEEAAPTFEYRGVAPEGRYTAAEIGAFLRAKPSATHEVRLDGWDDWRAANRVPEIVQAWLTDPVTPEPGQGAGVPTPALVPVQPSDSWDGGQAPRNAPVGSADPEPVPVSTPPSAPTAPAAAPAARGDGVRGAGEVWLGIGGDPSTTAPVAPSLRRLAAGLEARAGVVRARAYLATDQGGAVQVLDGWVAAEGTTPVAGFGRLGVARPAFGLADRLEDERRFWVAGASQELERASGWLPEATLGAGGGVRGQRWSVGAELADAGGDDLLGAVDLAAVEARARAACSFGPESRTVRVGVSAAWRMGLLEEASPRLLGALDAELVTARVGLVAQVVAGTEGEDGLPRFGALALGNAVIPVGGAAVRQVDVVAGGGGWDATLTGLPDEEDQPDAWWEARAGANVRWATPESELVTGLGYRLGIPQDLAVPLSHALLLEAAWRY